MKKLVKRAARRVAIEVAIIVIRHIRKQVEKK